MQQKSVDRWGSSGLFFKNKYQRKRTLSLLIVVFLQSEFLLYDMLFYHYYRAANK